MQLALAWNIRFDIATSVETNRQQVGKALLFPGRYKNALGDTEEGYTDLTLGLDTYSIDE